MKLINWLVLCIFVSGNIVGCAEPTYDVKYEVIGTSGTPDELAVSYTNETGEFSDEEVSLPWTYSFTTDSEFMDETGGFTSVTATFFSLHESSGVEVRLYVDGDLKKQSSEVSLGTVAQPSVDYTLE